MFTCLGWAGVWGEQQKTRGCSGYLLGTLVRLQIQFVSLCLQSLLRNLFVLVVVHLLSLLQQDTDGGFRFYVFNFCIQYHEESDASLAF